MEYECKMMFIPMSIKLMCGEDIIRTACWKFAIELCVHI